MSPIPDSIATASHRISQVALSIPQSVQSAFQKTDDIVSPFGTTDTFEPSSGGIQDFNQIIAQNKRLRTLAQQRNGQGGGEILFGEQPVVTTPGGGAQRVQRGLVKLGVGVLGTQLDGPLPGPADVASSGMVASGVKDVGLGLAEMLLASPQPVEKPTEQEEEECKKAHPLHRAVGPNEKQSIENLKRFSPNPSGIEGKYFYPTSDQAVDFANSRFNAHKPEMWRATGVLPHDTPHSHIEPVGEGPAIFVPNSGLPQIKHAKVRERIKPQ